MVSNVASPSIPASECGFTFIELVIVVSLLGVVASIAVPSMRKLILTQYVRTSAADLQSSFLYARSEAIKRAANVQVAPTSGSWTSGWTVQLTDGTVLRRRAALSTNVTPLSGSSTVTYVSNGRVTSLPPQIAFKSADASIPARCVQVDLSGRPSVIYDTDGNASNGCN